MAVKRKQPPKATRKPSQQLTNKQRVFIEEYLICWNATEAARRAGYGGDDDTLKSIGCENLAKPYILARVRERLAESAMKADEVLARIAEIARGDMDDFVDADSLSLDLRKAKRRGKMHLIKKFKITTTTKDDAQTDTIEFELYDKQTALQTLAKHHGLLVDRLKVEDWRHEFERAGVDPAEAEKLAEQRAESLAEELHRIAMDRLQAKAGK